MRQKRYRGLMLLMLGSLLFSGCQEAPYELTEEEEALIVNYSTHVVSKFNIYQKNGLTYVADKEESETEVDTEAVLDTEASGENNANSSGTVSGSSENAEETVAATLTSIYEDTGLTITYAGHEIMDSYMESSAYAAKPSNGKTFLVLNLQVENQTEEAITFNNFGSGTSYSARYQMETGKMYNAPSVMTLMSKEFSTYEGTIEPQTTVEMVLLFEIPIETTEVDSLILKIDRNGKVFEINL